MDYSKLSEITVKTQEELDAIPDDFKGRIYIDGGTPFARIYVKKKYNLNVYAWKNSSVVARENSSVVARENSSVVARENSSVVAWENSSVVATANVQIVDMLQGAKIKISGNARIVCMPKNIFEFMDFYGVKHTKTKATFYKAVHKYPDGTYHSEYNAAFTYRIGAVIHNECNQDAKENCGTGLHISHLDWALRFGQNWKDLAVLEIETKIANIVKPDDTDGKVRTSELKVLREVPLTECGAYGKILAKRLTR